MWRAAIKRFTANMSLPHLRSRDFNRTPVRRCTQYAVWQVVWCTRCGMSYVVRDVASCMAARTHLRLLDLHRTLVRHDRPSQCYSALVLLTELERQGHLRPPARRSQELGIAASALARHMCVQGCTHRAWLCMRASPRPHVTCACVRVWVRVDGWVVGGGGGGRCSRVSWYLCQKERPAAESHPDW
jgi:hypothetical protein